MTRNFKFWHSLIYQFFLLCLLPPGSCIRHIGLAKKSIYFFCHIKDTFSFSPITIDLDILSMLAISCVVWHLLFSINVSIWSLLTSTGQPDCGALSSKKPPARNFTHHFWHIWSVTKPSPDTAQIFLKILMVIQLQLYAFSPHPSTPPPPSPLILSMCPL